MDTKAHSCTHFDFFLFCLKNDLMNQVHSYSYSLQFLHTKNTLIAQMVGYRDRDNRLLMWPLETLSGKNLLCKAVKNKSSLPYYTKAVALMVTRSLCAQGKESSQRIIPFHLPEKVGGGQKPRKYDHFWNGYPVTQIPNQFAHMFIPGMFVEFPRFLLSSQYFFQIIHHKH